MSAAEEDELLEDSLARSSSLLLLEDDLVCDEDEDFFPEDERFRWGERDLCLLSLSLLLLASIFCFGLLLEVLELERDELSLPPPRDDMLSSWRSRSWVSAYGTSTDWSLRGHSYIYPTLAPPTLRSCVRARAEHEWVIFFLSVINILKTFIFY